ncbi:uncharacterized protein METZ01_LOCUS490518, partial [marine metagenome]
VVEEDRLAWPQMQGGERVLLHDPSPRIYKLHKQVVRS